MGILISANAFSICIGNSAPPITIYSRVRVNIGNIEMFFASLSFATNIGTKNTAYG